MKDNRIPTQQFPPIRWRIFGFLFVFGLLAYLQQRSLTITAAQMMPQLHLSQLQIGFLEQSFLMGYGLFQLPGGLFGQRYGARRTLVVISLIAFAAMISTAIAPFWAGGQSLFVVLLAAQLALGIAQAAIFPVSAGLFEEWFPPRHWPMVQGLQTMGLQLGAAMTPPLIASLMGAAGWQYALVVTTLPAIAFIALWGWYGRNSPRQHPSVSVQELAEIGERDEAIVDAGLDGRKLRKLLGDRNVLLLFVSYLCMNYAFYLVANWVFLYLIQERHFSLLESGWLATLPPLAAAAGAGAGGFLASAACLRVGARWGYRLVPLLALPAGGVLLFLGVSSSNAYAAVTALALSFAFVELTEGSFWGAAMAVGRGNTMVVGGIMNTGGNLGGIIGIPIVAYLSGHQMWRAAFLIGAGLAIVSALAWLGIDTEEKTNNMTPSPPSGTGQIAA
jgi:ACS family glucarate transporter-like MFS transporter